MEQAFKDLRGLMGKAQDMVTLAERFRERSSAGGSGVDRAASGDEAMDADMENELISLGIASPVTKTTAGALYHQQLSRQVRGGGLYLPCILQLLRAAWTVPGRQLPHAH